MLVVIRPENLFSLKSKEVNADKYPISEGRVPSSRLFAKEMDSTANISPISAGNVPLNLFSLRSKVCKEYSLLSSVGMVPYNPASAVVEKEAR